MKILFLSNYYNHHQKFLSEELNRITNGEFAFVETEEITPERLSLGWGEKDTPSYVVKYNSELDDLISDADVVIIGSAPYGLIRKRIHDNKLTFVYSERIYKNPVSIVKKLYHTLVYSRLYPQKKNVYLLCASAFSYADFSSLNTMRNKAYKWGYFPETKKHDVQTLISEKHPRTILWVARFIDLKHPEACITLGKKLADDGINDFVIEMVGTGELLDQIKAKIKSERLEEYVHVIGSLKPHEVREHMEKSEMFIFTSDRNEGWGAVLNEAMNSGCAVVASHSIGAVPFLIKDGENGMVYENGNDVQLFEKVKFLLGHPETRSRLGMNAYSTLSNCWNAEIAAERFFHLAQTVLNGDKSPDLFESGPCSRADILNNNWYRA